MTDLPSSLGIEAVELVAEGGRSVTVRVTGRWRRRRPELRGQPMLVVDGDGRRQRFLAMPEPPSLSGAAPGTWRMSFSVPAGIAPTLPGRTFLQLGGVLVPLPVGDVEPAESARWEAAERAARVEGLERELDAARVEGLERELDAARAESDRLRGEIADRERRLRTAEQHVHAERGLRAEVQQELSRRSRVARHDLRTLHERVGDLQRELTRMRRAVDEAQHLVAAAEAGRVGAERRLAERELAARQSLRAQPSRRELELHRAAPGASPPVAAPAVERVGDRVALRMETAMSRARSAGRDLRVAALERDLAAAREEIEAQRRRSARAYEAIELVRGELHQLRAAASQTPSPRNEPPPTPSGAPSSAHQVRL